MKLHAKQYRSNDHVSKQRQLLLTTSDITVRTWYTVSTVDFSCSTTGITV